MKKLVKIISMLICFVVMFSVFSCGGKSTKDDGVITMFKWDFSSLNSAKRQNTAIYSKMKEVNGGYDLKSVTTGYGDWESFINNLYNTGNLPDVFVHYTVDRPAIFKKMIKNGSVLNWDKYVTAEKYPNIYNKLHKFDWVLDRVDYLNGGHYFLPITIKQTHVMFVRKDWIDNLNNKLATILVEEGIIQNTNEMDEGIYQANKFVLPTTLVEFYRLAKAFTLYDPDGNGKNDTYGYTCSGDLMWYNNWVFEAFGSTYWGWVKDGKGGYTASWITEENKNALAFLNKLYQEGIMDPDYSAMKDPTKISNFCSNRTGIMVDNVYYNNYVEQLRAANNLTTAQAENCIAVIAPPKGETGTYGMRGNPDFWCGTCINAGIPKAKITAVLDMFEYMLSNDGYDTFTYGIEGVNYKVEGEEKISLMGQDANGYNYTAKAKDSAFDLHMFFDWSLSYNPGFSSNYDLVKGYMDMANDYTYVDDYCCVQTPLVVSNWDNIGNESYEQFVKIIGTNYNCYSKNTIGTINWDTIKTVNSNFDGAFEAFKNTFLNSWQGKNMIEEYSTAVLKIKK